MHHSPSNAVGDEALVEVERKFALVAGAEDTIAKHLAFVKEVRTSLARRRCDTRRSVLCVLGLPHSPARKAELSGTGRSATNHRPGPPAARRPPRAAAGRP